MILFSSFPTYQVLAALASEAGLLPWIWGRQMLVHIGMAQTVAADVNASATENDEQMF